ncbi:MAG: arsenic transporter [Faecalibacterium sp.]|jgi:Na+/H+ antiporter NhaD/arsenite permease-like protein|nr:arsenic transporter [Faecalibacterium sp.]
MLVALVLFLLTYVLMLCFSQARQFIALGSALIFVALGSSGVYDMPLPAALHAVDYNVLLMIGGTMGIVSLFIQSGMPARLSELLIAKVPNVQWAVAALALFAGFISAFVDNVATVLMVAPVGLEISRKMKISPVPVLIAISVSSNLQGAATLVGDTTSILLGNFAGMNFLNFFWMDGKPGIFWGVELGAVVSAFVLLFLFRKEKQEVHSGIPTKVQDRFPTFLLLLTVALLIAASFLPQPAGGWAATLYGLRNGVICMVLCLFGVVRACLRAKSAAPLMHVLGELDTDTLLLLFGLFIVIAGIQAAGVIDAIANLFVRVAGDNPFVLYTLIVFASVGLSAFIDNIPYVATMLPVVQSVAAMMHNGAGVAPYVFYFGLLSGATLGGNLTPIGASANIAAIGILRKHGERVTTRDFLRIGVPFTLAAVAAGYAYIWFVWGI